MDTKLNNESKTAQLERVNASDSLIAEYPYEWSRNIQFKEVEGNVFYRRIYDKQNPRDKQHIDRLNAGRIPGQIIYVMPALFGIATLLSIAWRIYIRFAYDPSEWNYTEWEGLVIWMSDFAFISRIVRWRFEDNENGEILIYNSRELMNSEINLLELLVIVLVGSTYNNEDLVFRTFWFCRLLTSLSLSHRKLITSSEWAFLVSSFKSDSPIEPQ